MSVTLFARSADYPTLTVEIGFSTVSSGSSTWATGTWNTAKWSGRDVVWTDVSDYVRAISTSRERNRDTDTFPVGTATVVLSNVDARFTPANTSGPYASGGVTKVVPKVPIRIRATWNSVTYGVFYGRVNSWRDDYPGQGKDCVTTVTCTDVLADLAVIDLAALVAPEGAGELAGARISRILNSSGWAFGTDINAGGIATCQGTSLGENALDMVQKAAESDGGVVFADQDGDLTFQDGYYPTGARSSRATTAQITFGSGVGEVKFLEPVLTYDDTLIFNDCTSTINGGNPERTTDADSISLYGRRSLSRTELVSQTDAQAKVLADLDILRFADPEYRVAGVTVVPASSPAAYWPLALDSRFGDYCVAKVPTPSGITITRDVAVSGTSHNITSEGGWVIRYAFTSLTPYKGTWGGWDSGLWDTVTFFA